jgi:hypothetical protein
VRNLFVPQRAGRVVEATIDQIVATGAAGGAWGTDPVDGDRGWRPAGQQGREVPWWTSEKARIYAVNAYRSNPMATAIIDTYVAFCVGDSGVTWQASNPDVARVVDEFWNDPRNALDDNQELLFRSHLIMGESLYELMVGGQTGVVRYSPIDVGRIAGVDLYRGNPMWPAKILFNESDEQGLTVAAVNDETGLREGQAMYWPSFKTLDTDVRGTPFLMSVLDQLDSFDTVLSNLVDRTALARYLVWDVTVEGGQPEVDAFVQARGGLHVPRSGSVEVHNSAVTWEPKSVSTGAEEDSVAARQVLTQVAAGAGLAKTWLADPEDSNRATSLTMAEPVRRRVGSVQKMWLRRQAEFVRFAVDRAVAAGRLPRMVAATDPRTGERYDVPAAQAVTVTGPEVAAADAQLQAQVMLNLSTGLEKLVATGVMSKEAARIAARKAWESYVGVPYNADLDVGLDEGGDKGDDDAKRDDVATHIEEQQAAEARRKGMRRGDPEALHDYWTRGEGLAKWRTSPHPWTALYKHLLKHMGGDQDLAKRTAASWYHDVFGHWPAEAKTKAV